jgi:hypothetical protein
MAMPESAPDTELRPAGVNIAAAVLTLLTLFGALILVGAVAALFFQRNPIVPNIGTVRIILASFDLLLLLFLCCCAWTVVGLFRLRSWARTCMLLIGGLDFVVFGIFSTLMLIARRNPLVIGMDAHPTPAMPFPLGTVILVLAILYGAIALIGLWWMVYFNLPSVRAAFAAANSISLPRSSPRLTP